MSIRFCGVFGVLAITAPMAAGILDCEPAPTSVLGDFADANPVLIDGSIAMIGDPYNDSHDENAGAVYVFEKQAGGEWVQRIILSPEDLVAGDRFGLSLSLHGDSLLVSAPYANNATGCVYAYSRDSDGDWTLDEKLVNPEPASLDYFGYRIAMDGDVAVISCLYDDDNGSSSGSAYVYEKTFDSKWAKAQKLLASDGESSDEFGRSVDLLDNVAVIGATGAETAYVFERNAKNIWSESAKLMPASGSYRFGIDVSIGTGVVLVSRDYDFLKNVSGGSSGAYVFEVQADGSWLEIGRLQGPYGYGATVSISGNIAITGNSSYGTASVYEQGEDGAWNSTATLSSGGWSWSPAVDLHGTTALVGNLLYERQDDGYWGPKPIEDCDENGICDVDDIVSDPWRDQNGNFILDECEVGACCISTSVICEISEEYDCLRFGGSWLGLGTTCDGSPCPNACLGDVNGDGEVSTNDILTLIANWGPCP